MFKFWVKGKKKDPFVMMTWQNKCKPDTLFVSNFPQGFKDLPKKMFIGRKGVPPVLLLPMTGEHGKDNSQKAFCFFIIYFVSKKGIMHNLKQTHQYV